MAYNIALCKFNNYFNRQISNLETLEEFLQSSQAYEIFQEKNFVPGDGITTELVTNWERNYKPDYCIVYNTLNQIVSRWYIIDFKFIRGKQYRAVLKADLVSENREAILDATCYIEKGQITNPYDVAVYNKEDLPLNQIKVSETALKDETNCAWLVGWFDSSLSATDFHDLFKDGTKYKYINYGKAPDYTTADLASWHPELQNKTYTYLDSANGDYLGIRSTVTWVNGMLQVKYFSFDQRTNRLTNFLYSKTSASSNNYYGNINGTGPDAGALNDYINGLSQTNLLSYLITYVPNNYSDFALDYAKFNGKTVYDSTTQKYYEVRVTYNAPTTGTLTAAYNSALGVFLKNRMAYYDVTANNNDTVTTYSLSSLTINLVEVARATGKIWTDASTIVPNESIMNDAPYCGFCIPYGDVRVYATGRHDVNIYKEQSFGAVNLLSYILQNGSYLYDVQLLPYCPILNENELYMDGETIRYDNLSSSRVITFYNTDGTTFSTNNSDVVSKGFIFFSSSFTFDIEHSIPDKASATQKYLANNTEMYRLVSPNYSSYFEFSPYENNGITKINVDCTYKPYKSYIHLNPDFHGLFGKDYNDNRGLIITSDFSIPQVNDAWQQYQINNKNYSQVFERQVQNMKFNNKWNTAESVFNAVTGTVSGSISGGLTGAVAGGIPGAVAGAVVGGVSSAVGGAADVARTIQTQQEAMSYAKDMYNYNLQNIQALPNSLASVSTFDANNKLFPFIEKYDCTAQEKEIFMQKIVWSGMKIGRIGKIRDFVPEVETFIQAKLIQIDISETDLEPSQVAEIALELSKGVIF